MKIQYSETAQIEMEKFLISTAIELIHKGISYTDKKGLTRQRDLTIQHVAEVHLELKRTLSLFMF